MVAYEIGYLAEHRNAIPTLARWHYDEWNWFVPHLTIDVRAALLQNFAQCGSIPTALVALRGEAVLGMACLIPNDMKTRPELSPWLAGVLVGRQHRGQGIGAALCDRATHEASRLKIKRLYLFTFDKERFYSNLGWSEIEKTEYLGASVTIMAKELAA